MYMYNYYGLGRHIGICLWFVDTDNTDQMLAFESVGRVVSNVECGWPTYLSHDIFSEFYRHTINPVHFCACLKAVCTDTSTPWISVYQSMGFLGHLAVQCPHIFGFVDVPGMSSACSNVVARIHRTRLAPARLKLLEMTGNVTLQGSSIAKFGWMFLGLGKMITYSLKYTQTHPKWSEWFVWEHPVQRALEYWNSASIREWRCWKFKVLRGDIHCFINDPNRVISGIPATTPIKSKHGETNMCAKPYPHRLHRTLTRTCKHFPRVLWHTYIKFARSVFE